MLRMELQTHLLKYTAQRSSLVPCIHNLEFSLNPLSDTHIHAGRETKQLLFLISANVLQRGVVDADGAISLLYAVIQRHHHTLLTIRQSHIYLKFFLYTEPYESAGLTGITNVLRGRDLVITTGQRGKQKCCLFLFT